MQLQLRTVTLRVVVGSRNFDMRQAAFDTAIDTALMAATGALGNASFRIIESGAEIVDEGFVAANDEARRQSRPDDVT